MDMELSDLKAKVVEEVNLLPDKRLVDLLAAQSIILPLTEQSTTISRDIYAQLRIAGTPVDDIDLLIAGTAIANRLVLVTHNQKHFGRIAQLPFEDWTQPQ